MKKLFDVPSDPSFYVVEVWALGQHRAMLSISDEFRDGQSRLNLWGPFGWREVLRYFERDAPPLDVSPMEEQVSFIRQKLLEMAVMFLDGYEDD